MLYKYIITVISSCLILGCATPGDVPRDGESEASTRRVNCIFRSSIRGYSVLDESNLIIDASGRRQYHVVLSRRALGLRSSWAIAFDSQGSRVCAGFDEVIFDGHMDNQSIRIASIRELSPEDYDDLLIQYGRKEPEIKQTPAPREVEGAEVEELDPAAIDNLSGD